MLKTKPSLRIMGERAEIWALGQKAGEIWRWKIEAENAYGFELTATTASAIEWLGLPVHLRPNYEVHIKTGDYYFWAPVKPFDALNWQGLAKLETRKYI